MRLTVFAAAITFLLWETPLLAQDFDGDEVDDFMDNCSEAVNADQVDTDVDDCGNACDADYDQTGVVGFPDLFKFGRESGGGNPLFCHVPPIPAFCIIGFADWAFLVNVSFGRPPGPSGTTAGTTACP
jgi:hypothetical protein